VALRGKWQLPGKKAERLPPRPSFRLLLVRRRRGGDWSKKKRKLGGAFPPSLLSGETLQSPLASREKKTVAWEFTEKIKITVGRLLDAGGEKAGAANSHQIRATKRAGKQKLDVKRQKGGGKGFA